MRSCISLSGFYSPLQLQLSYIQELRFGTGTTTAFLRPRVWRLEWEVDTVISRTAAYLSVLSYPIYLKPITQHVRMSYWHLLVDSQNKSLLPRDIFYECGWLHFRADGMSIALAQNGPFFARLGESASA